MGDGAWRRKQGDEAEAQAVAFYEGQGYRVCARNFTCRYGEVDLIAEREETVVFVEVRMKSSDIWGEPSGTVTFAKRQKVVRTAMHYLFENDLRGRMVRFDVVSVVGRGEKARLEHLPDAFDAGM